MCQEDKCPVCLGHLCEKAEIFQTKCNHKFHPTCLEEWFNMEKNKCPMCRASLNQDRKTLLPNSEEIPAIDEIINLATTQTDYLTNETNREEMLETFRWFNPVRSDRKGNPKPRATLRDTSRMLEVFLCPGNEDWTQLFIQADVTGVACLGPLAELYHDQGCEDLAIKYGKMAAERGSDSYSLYNLGKALKEKGEREEAVKYFKIAFENFQDHFSANSLGVYCFEEKKYEEALKYLQKAAELGSVRALENMKLVFNFIWHEKTQVCISKELETSFVNWFQKNPHRRRHKKLQRRFQRIMDNNKPSCF